MNSKIHLSPEKKRFQLERLILFSDAVFAIAITLLVIDVKVPEFHDHPTDHRLLVAMINLIPKITGFLLSFFLIGLYWTVHHRFFGFVIDYTGGLLWINLLFLLGIVFLPFSTSFYSEYIYLGLKIPIILYGLNFCFIGVMSYIMHRYVTKASRKMTKGLTDEMASYYAFRALTVPVIFAFIVGVSFFNTFYAIFIPPLIPLIIHFITKIYKKRRRQILKEQGQ